MHDTMWLRPFVMFVICVFDETNHTYSLLILMGQLSMVLSTAVFMKVPLCDHGTTIPQLPHHNKQKHVTL